MFLHADTHTRTHLLAQILPHGLLHEGLVEELGAPLLLRIAREVRLSLYAGSKGDCLAGIEFREIRTKEEDC